MALLVSISVRKQKNTFMAISTDSLVCLLKKVHQPNLKCRYISIYKQQSCKFAGLVW